MEDNTKGRKTNRVMLNIAQCPGVEPPEPGIAPVVIDGQPIHAVRYIRIEAGSEQMTVVTLQFEAEVAGVIAGAPVEDILRNQH